MKLPLHYLQQVSLLSSEPTLDELQQLFHTIETMLKDGCDKYEVAIHLFKVLGTIIQGLISRLQDKSSYQKRFQDWIAICTMVLSVLLKLLSKNIQTKLLFSQQTRTLKILIKSLPLLPTIRLQVLGLEAIYRITPKNKQEILKLGLNNEFLKIEGNMFQFSCRDYLLVGNNNLNLPFSLKGTCDQNIVFVDLDCNECFIVNYKKVVDYSQVTVLNEKCAKFGDRIINLEQEGVNALVRVLKQVGFYSIELKNSKVSMDVQTVPTETARFMDENWQPAIPSPKLSPIAGDMDLFGSGGLDDTDIVLESELFDFSGRQGGDEKNGGDGPSAESISAPNHLENLVSPEWDKDSLLMDGKKSRRPKGLKNIKSDHTENSNDLFDLASIRPKTTPKVEKKSKKDKAGSKTSKKTKDSAHQIIAVNEIDEKNVSKPGIELNSKSRSRRRNKRKASSMTEDFGDRSKDAPNTNANLPNDVFDLNSAVSSPPARSKGRKSDSMTTRPKRSKLKTGSEAIDSYLDEFNDLKAQELNQDRVAPADVTEMDEKPVAPSTSSKKQASKQSAPASVMFSECDLPPCWPETDYEGTEIGSMNSNLITSKSVFKQIKLKKSLPSIKLVDTSPKNSEYSAKKHYSTPVKSVTGTNVIHSTPIYTRLSSMFDLSDGWNKRASGKIGFEPSKPIDSDQVMHSLSIIASKLSEVNTANQTYQQYLTSTVQKVLKKIDGIKNDDFITYELNRVVSDKIESEKRFREYVSTMKEKLNAI